MLIQAWAREEGKNDSDVFSAMYICREEEELAPDKKLLMSQTLAVRGGQSVPVSLQIWNNPGLRAYLFYLECDRSVFYLDADGEGAYMVQIGDASQGGTMIAAPAGDHGWQILWFSTEPATEDGTLFTVPLKVGSETDRTTAEIRLSFSPENTITGANIAQLDEETVQLVPGENMLLGDVDGNGVVTVADVVRIARYIISDLTLTDEQLLLADVTADGNVTAADVIRLLRYLVRLAELS